MRAKGNKKKFMNSQFITLRTRKMKAHKCNSVQQIKSNDPKAVTQL
jgi:hypothetical protein